MSEPMPAAKPGGSQDGSCLCGSITYSIRSDAVPIYNVVCHCVNCAKQTGGAFSTNAIWKKTDVEVNDGKNTLTRYRDLATDSGQQLDRYFCNACGSPIYAVTPLWDEILSIFCGTYDDSERWRPPFKEQYLDCKKFWVPEFGRWKDGVRANGGGEAEGEDEEMVASRHARGAL